MTDGKPDPIADILIADILMGSGNKNWGVGHDDVLLSLHYCLSH